MEDPALMSPFRRFAAGRALTRQQLAAIHARRDEAHSRLYGPIKLDKGGNVVSGYHRAWENLAEQKPTSNASRNFLTRRRETLQGRIKRTSNEIEKLNAQQREIRHRQMRAAAITAALATLPVAFIAGARTNVGRRTLARAALRFRPLSGVESVIDAGRGELHQSIVRHTLEAERRMKGKVSAGVERVFDKIAGEIPRAGRSVDTVPLSSVPAHEHLTTALREFQSEGGGRPGLIDRAQARFYDRVIYPTFGNPLSNKVAEEKFGTGFRRMIHDRIQRPIARRVKLPLMEEAHTPDESPLLLRRRGRVFADSAEREVTRSKGARFAEQTKTAGILRRKAGVAYDLGLRGGPEKEPVRVIGKRRPEWRPKAPAASEKRLAATQAPTTARAVEATPGPVPERSAPPAPYTPKVTTVTREQSTSAVRYESPEDRAIRLAKAEKTAAGLRAAGGRTPTARGVKRSQEELDALARARAAGRVERIASTDPNLKGFKPLKRG